MNAATILLRQAHPKFIEGNLPTSQVFQPNSYDGGKMSVYDGDQVSPNESYIHYTKVLNMQSHSVWAVTKGEADSEGVPGGADFLPDFPSHAKIDFPALPEKSWRKVAKRLKVLAISRGCQYLPA